MAYPTGVLSLVLENIDRRAIMLKKHVTQVRDRMAAANAPSGEILNLVAYLRTERAEFAAAIAVPGIADYARAQKSNASLDVVAEFNAMLTAIDNVTTWIATNFPKDGNGFLLERTLGVDGPVERLFTPAQTAGLRTQLESIINAIA